MEGENGEGVRWGGQREKREEGKGGKEGRRVKERRGREGKRGRKGKGGRKLRLFTNEFFSLKQEGREGGRGEKTNTQQLTGKWNFDLTRVKFIPTLCLCQNAFGFTTYAYRHMLHNIT